jgi:hypothetical protein
MEITRISSYFFLKHTGELRIIKLRRKRGSRSPFNNQTSPAVCNCACVGLKAAKDLWTYRFNLLGGVPSKRKYLLPWPSPAIISPPLLVLRQLLELVTCSKRSIVFKLQRRLLQPLLEEEQGRWWIFSQVFKLETDTNHYQVSSGFSG